MVGNVGELAMRDHDLTIAQTAQEVARAQWPIVAVSVVMLVDVAVLVAVIALVPIAVGVVMFVTIAVRVAVLARVPVGLVSLKVAHVTREIM